MGTEKDPLQGFSWKSGDDRDTTGIIMWSDVFFHENSSGEKIAIVLIDTQGLFDSETDPKHNSAIFGLGTLISSIQLFNVTYPVDEKHFEYLHFATTVAKLAYDESQDESGKPFQTLLFLIRDYPNHGLVGGLNYLDKLLQVKPSQPEKLRTVREYIRSSFDELKCGLLPNPGKKVTAGGHDGHWGLMDEDFKVALVEVIEDLLKGENLSLKNINGKQLTGLQFEDAAKTFFEVYQSGDLPEPSHVVTGLIKLELGKLVQKCLENYKETIIREKKILNKKTIEIVCQLTKIKSQNMYLSVKKIGHQSDHENYYEELELAINKEFDDLNDRIKLEDENKDLNKEKDLRKCHDEQENLEKTNKKLKQSQNCSIL